MYPRALPVLVTALSPLMLQGCLFTVTESVPSGSRPVQLADFSDASDTPPSIVQQVPREVIAPPEVVTTTRETRIGDTEVSETRREVIVNQRIGVEHFDGARGINPHGDGGIMDL